MKRIKDINKAKSIVIILSLVLMVLLIHFSSNNKFEKKDFNNASVLIKANDYYELSKVYLRDEEYEKSKNEFNKAKALYIEEELIDELISLSVKRAKDIYATPNGINNAIELLEEVLEIAKNSKAEETYIVYFRLGLYYWYQDRKVEAINYKLKALSIVEEKNIEKEIGTISIDIGVDYAYSGNSNEAIKYFEKSLEQEYSNSEDEVYVKMYALINLIESYNRINDIENSERCVKQIYDVLDGQLDLKIKEDALTTVYANRADLEVKKGNSDRALELIELAKERYENEEEFTFYDFDIKLAEIYGDIYYKLGDYSNALESHKYAESLAKERGLTYLQELHNEMIFLDYKALGDYENTILYLERNNELKDEIKNNQEDQYSQYLDNEFQAKKNQDIIAKLEENKAIMKILIVTLFIIIVIIIIFSIFIYNKNRQIKSLNKLFKALSITDGLTKIPNRRALDEYLRGNWELLLEKSMPISFIMIDIDYFKKYNDNYGHPEGDIVLERVAKTIKESCREDDFIARYGGEEFIIIMTNTSETKVKSIAERIRKNIYVLNITHEYSEVSDRITLSMGISTVYDENEKSYEKYIKYADLALYKAKSKGRNRYVHKNNIEID